MVGIKNQKMANLKHYIIQKVVLGLKIMKDVITQLTGYLQKKVTLVTSVKVKRKIKSSDRLKGLNQS